MHVVVIGASGNVGTAILRRFRDDESVTAVTAVARRIPTSTPPAPYDVARWVACDVASDEPDEVVVARLAAAVAGADAVIHLAWAIQPSHDRRYLARVNVDGTRRVVEAVARASVPHLVVASSVGAYSPAPDDVPRSEGWATHGVPSSSYSADKAAVERVLDEAEVAHPRLVIARVRPALIFQRRAGSEVARLFLGPLVPRFALGGHLPVLPWPTGLRLQAVHGDDVAAAYREVVVRQAKGAFNVAAPEVLGAQDLADLLSGGRYREVAPPLLRGAVSAAWHARAVAAGPGWLDMAMAAPLLDTSRAERELDFRPRWTAQAAVQDVLAGITERSGTASPPLKPGR
ncbi:NAD-dependent epimerase/dehydratase family protein [Cellulomonas rhizosphaerae]|uniref:NAD-dependent epimerase/dehydratase family protein n=1 Tax=Cellulomonas rhizosphaerae TaxID=2293719 RepID=A0A413RPZ2_9CELL|nr:NAD-dependent epimerase/dehydratase family protein [Cellulomonas rhizosphaerae]RHA44059.1 NAD-dependent epimerase/dehydratase family protein [Cellulomonas rhizosphaerae]